MNDSPKTLADVKALLEQAVKVVEDLQSPSPEPTDNSEVSEPTEANTPPTA